MQTSAKKSRVVVSLPNENAYQSAQGLLAKSAGETLGFDIEVIHAGDDAINQSQQLLNVVHSRSEPRPTAFLVEPVTGAGLHRVAEAAVRDGVAWVISNCDVDYIQQLRKHAEVPVFAVTQGQTEIGRIQGQQLAALLPAGGSVLYIQGPTSSSVSNQRRQGMEVAKPEQIRLTTLRSGWSEESSCRVVEAWLSLATSRAERFDLVAGHTHELALGARRAFQNMSDSAQKKAWLELPSIGVGIAQQVERLVDDAVLTAAVVTSLTMDLALKTLASALKTKPQLAECYFVPARSYPSLERLQRRAKGFAPHSVNSIPF